MAENLTIARPYAKAVFELALAAHGLEDWEQILQILAQVASNHHVLTLLDSPVISQAVLIDLFLGVATDALPELEQESPRRALKNFLTTLAEKKRLAILPGILSQYRRLVAAQQDIKQVVVTSAYALNEQRQQAVTKALTHYLRSKVSATFQEEPSLIGGMVIRSGNWVMDGSIKGKLQRLKQIT